MRNIYLLLPALGGVMFGSSGVFVRFLTSGGIDAPTLLFLRFSIGLVIMFLAILLSDSSLFKINSKNLLLFIGSGLCILFLNVFYNTSINMVPLSVAAVLLSTAPIFVIIFAYFIFNESLGFIKVVSIFFAIFGCALASGLLELSSFNISILGCIFGVCAALFYAFYTMVSKKSISKGFHTYTILFYSLIFISLVLIPFTNFSSIVYFISFNPSFNILVLLLHSLISFALPYIFLTVSLNHVDSGIATTLLSGLEPVAAMLFGLIFFLEIPSLLMFIGVVVTIVSLIFLSKEIC